MKILYPNLNILNTRCDDRDNKKEECCCISIVVSSKPEYLGKKKQKQYEGYCGHFYYCLEINQGRYGFQ